MSLSTHILAVEVGNHAEWFEGKFQDYEDDKIRRLGDEAIERPLIKS